MIFLIICLILAKGESQEVTTPASLLGPRHFNHHPFDAEQYLRSLNLPVPTKQGPVLFPNDGPPAPRPPLVVTSRPLIESIANSNLNPLPQNNTQAVSSNNLAPYFGRYKPHSRFYDVSTEVNQGLNKGIFDDYEERTPSPIIYKAVSNQDYQQQRATQPHQEPRKYEILVNDPDYTHQQSNEIHDETSSEYKHGQNYAFSYSVKDRKTGDDFSHSQKSKGSATNGEYRVRLPDGRMQIVSYTADENGYKADVRYDDEKPSYSNNDNDYKNNDIEYNDNVNYIHKNNYKYTDNNHGINNKVNVDYDFNNALQRDFKYNKESPKDYYNNYESKEYINGDYSSEYNSNYSPYTSKFSKFLSSGKTEDNLQQITANIKPSPYNDVKDLFVTKNLHNDNEDDNGIRIDYNNPANLNRPSELEYTDYIPTTENVIGGTKQSFYANSQYNKIPLFSTTTPRSYLLSTISSLKNRFVQPVLSARFIDKINKYISFN